MKQRLEFIVLFPVIVIASLLAIGYFIQIEDDQARDESESIPFMVTPEGDTLLVIKEVKTIESLHFRIPTRAELDRIYTQLKEAKND